MNVDDAEWFAANVGDGKRWFNGTHYLSDAIEVLRHLLLNRGDGGLVSLKETLRSSRSTAEHRIQFRATLSLENQAWLDGVVGEGKIWFNETHFLSDTFLVMRALLPYDEEGRAKGLEKLLGIVRRPVARASPRRREPR